MRQTAPALTAVLAAALLLASAVAPAASAQSSGRVHIYDGTHVSFRVTDDELTEYAVDDETVLGSVAVRSAAEVDADASLDANLSAVVDVDGTGLSAESRSRTGATVTAGESTELTGHDNEHGVLVVRAGDAPQVVEANLSRGANASAAGDSRIAVSTANGTEGSFIVVGNGSVAVNGNGDVVARLGEDGTLVFRAYPDGKGEADERQESLIADGIAAAEVHVMREDGSTVTDTITYGQNTSVEAKETGEGAIEMAVERSSHEGRVVVTSVSEGAMAVENLRVTVDGEAAAAASSYGDLKGAIGGGGPKYLVADQGAGAEAAASTDVLVAVDHFSTRTIELSRGSETTTTTEATGTSTDAPTDEPITTTSDGQPGFGVVAALVSLAGVAFVSRRR